jgi:hypothetical protein
MMDSTTTDSICAAVEQDETFGRFYHNNVTLWHNSRQMMGLGTLHDYGVKVASSSASTLPLALKS